LPGNAEIEQGPQGGLKKMGGDKTTGGVKTSLEVLAENPWIREKKTRKIRKV